MARNRELQSSVFEESIVNASEVNIQEQEQERGVEVVTPGYRLWLERDGGYAARKVEITGALFRGIGGKLCAFIRRRWVLTGRIRTFE